MMVVGANASTAATVVLLRSRAEIKNNVFGQRKALMGAASKVMRTLKDTQGARKWDCIEFGRMGEDPFGYNRQDETRARPSEHTGVSRAGKRTNFPLPSLSASS